MDENEELVKWGLEKYPDVLKLLQTSPMIGQPGYKQLLGDDNANKVQRFGPQVDPDTIGFFVAKFKKT